MKYVTGICCGDDLETAYDNFKEIFEKYNDEDFDNCETSKKGGKRNIRIHSYTQSFDSSVSPEEAHRIGVEWAKKSVWREQTDNRQYSQQYRALP